MSDQFANSLRTNYDQWKCPACQGQLKVTGMGAKDEGVKSQFVRYKCEEPACGRIVVIEAFGAAEKQAMNLPRCKP